MIIFEQVLSPSLVSSLRAHLESLASNLTPDVSNYAKGRMRFWLEHEGPLSNAQAFRPGVHDERLWDWCKRVFPSADLGLVAYGPVGIGWHRDATYADYEAMSINLGEIEAWGYDYIYPEFHYSPPESCNISNPTLHEMPVGQVIRFNSKNPHTAVNPAADRWSIQLWRVSYKRRYEFRTYKMRSKNV